MFEIYSMVYFILLLYTVFILLRREKKMTSIFSNSYCCFKKKALKKFACKVSRFFWKRWNDDGTFSNVKSMYMQGKQNIFHIFHLYFYSFVSLCLIRGEKTWKKRKSVSLYFRNDKPFPFQNAHNRLMCHDASELIVIETNQSICQFCSGKMEVSWKENQVQMEKNEKNKFSLNEIRGHYSQL